MANPVLIAKLALVAADPKTWQKSLLPASLFLSFPLHCSAAAVQ